MENTQDILNNALANFKKISENKLNENKLKEKIDETIINEKKYVLLPIVNLFRRFVEMGLVVYNSNVYDVANNFYDKVEEEGKEVFFKFSQRETIGKHAPGIDLIVRHPCKILISVPNKNNIEKDGVVVLHVLETKCPQANLIKNKTFRTVEDACNALANFFAQNVVKITNQQL